MTNEKSILVPRRLLDALKEYMEWGKSRVDPRPLAEWMDEVLAKPDEPTPGRCPTCSRWLEMRCAVCGPVDSSDEPGMPQWLESARVAWNANCRCSCAACAAFDTKLIKARSAQNRAGER